MINHSGTPAHYNNLLELFRVRTNNHMGIGIEGRPQPRILLVEDDQDIAQLVQLHLQDLNVDSVHCDRGDTALGIIQADSWDLIILDLRLPGIGGLELCKHLREHGDHTPILMLTAKTTELDRVLGLELGADDYMTKPFSPLELVARVKVILRRGQHLSALLEKTTLDQIEVISCGSLKIDIKKYRVTNYDQVVELTAKEFELLLHFSKHPDQVFRRSELLDKIWGYGHKGYEHTVNSHINRLRSKIEMDPAMPEKIITVWGVGYKFVSTQL